MCTIIIRKLLSGTKFGIGCGIELLSHNLTLIIYDLNIKVVLKKGSIFLTCESGFQNVRYNYLNSIVYWYCVWHWVKA